MAGILAKNLIHQVFNLSHIPPAPDLDLVPWNFWLFLLKEKKFQTMDEIKENVTRYLMVILKEVFADCLEKLEAFWGD